MVPPTHHFSDMCPFFFTPQSYKISTIHASVALRSSDRPNRDNRPNKPNRQALPEQRHHTGIADAAPPPPPRTLHSSATPHRLSPPIRSIGPIPARCLSRATPHRLSQPIGPIPLRCEAALTERRTFPKPRQGLKPCVAPYFADRGVGDMRGQPRRWWQAVIPPHNPLTL